MSVVQTLTELATQNFAPLVVDIENESHMHSGPATDSHFKLTIVSEQFVGVRAVKRHQQVYALAQALLDGPVHALALHLYTPEEWKARGEVIPESPTCRGGSKLDP